MSIGFVPGVQTVSISQQMAAPITKRLVSWGMATCRPRSASQTVLGQSISTVLTRIPRIYNRSFRGQLFRRLQMIRRAISARIWLCNFAIAQIYFHWQNFPWEAINSIPSKSTLGTRHSCIWITPEHGRHCGSYIPRIIRMTVSWVSNAYKIKQRIKDSCYAHRISNRFGHAHWLMTRQVWMVIKGPKTGRRQAGGPNAHPVITHFSCCAHVVASHSIATRFTCTVMTSPFFSKIMSTSFRTAWTSISRLHPAVMWFCFLTRDMWWLHLRPTIREHGSCIATLLFTPPSVWPYKSWSGSKMLRISGRHWADHPPSRQPKILAITGTSGGVSLKFFELLLTGFFSTTTG